MTNKNIARYIIALLLCCASYDFVWPATWQSTVVSIGSDGKLTYKVDGEGNSIPDFSYAGYKNGTVPIPVIAVTDTVSPIAGDNTVNIQTGIDRVAARSLVSGVRGALLMKAGRRYWVSGTLTLNASGVVLRGVGEGSDSLTNTVIYATGDSASQPTVIIAGYNNSGSNTSAWSSLSGSNVNITSDTVHVGDRTFQVASASSFSVGDNIVIEHDTSRAWFQAIDYGGVPGNTTYWPSQNIPIKFNRFITAISGTTITIDAPVFTTMVRALSQAYIYKTTRNNILTNIGIEKLRIDIVNPYNESSTVDGDEHHHASTAIWLGKIEDAWVRHCTVLHFSLSGIKTSIATRVTVDSCTAVDPISIITGERRYNFDTDFASQLVLFSNCYARYARHAFVSNGTSSTSGIVFYNCTSEGSFNPSEGHRIWSQGLLYDKCTDINRSDGSTNIAIGLYNRGDYGSGHGWASVHSVAWNCSIGTGKIIIQKPPTAQNYAIGCTAGQVTGTAPPAPFSQPTGYIEGTNVAGINPTSLYQAQLIDRTGEAQPVELVSLSATASERTVTVNWATATETNNYGFDVERSDAAQKSVWRKIGFVPGAGTSSVPNRYSFTEKNVEGGSYFYRLKQIDRNGKFEYSQMAEVTIGRVPTVLALTGNYPNPFNPSTTIGFTVPYEARAVVKIFDVLGKEVATLFDAVAVAGNQYAVPFDASALSSGIYFSQLEFGGRRMTKSMMLMK